MSVFQLNRRSFVASASVATMGGGVWECSDAMNTVRGRIRQITRGPKHHWFGYYDKLQFDPSSRFVLGMQVDFEHRSPKADDQIEIGMVDRSYVRTFLSGVSVKRLASRQTSANL